MKDILEVYAQPYDPARPTVCFDEKSLQLLADSRPGLPLKPGHPRRQDYEYVRRGTRNIFIFVEPKAGWRHVLVTRRRTKEDLAKAVRYLVDVLYSDAPLIDLVWDNLNTHATDTLIEIFGKTEADRILARLALHPTPLHASWLNIAEIDLNAMTGQCLDRRIPDEWTLSLELIAWESRRNQLHRPIAWSFDWKRAKRLFKKRKRRNLPNAATTQNQMVKPLVPLKAVRCSIATGACEAGSCDGSFMEQEFNHAIVAALASLVKLREETHPESGVWK